MRFPTFVIAMIFATVANANVTLAPLFRDGAVLQRDNPVPVWGTADAGEKISVTFAGQSLATTASADGRWQVTLAPLAASATPADLVVKGSSSLTVHDVVVGEVWLASGQSNMELFLAYARNEIKAAKFPLLRQFKVGRQPSFIPLSTAKGDWVPALPATAGQFSAVAYYFGLDLLQKLHVPVGIINSSWGGTGIDTWIAPDAFRATPELAKYFERQEKAVRATPEVVAAYESLRAGSEKAKAAARSAGQPFDEPAPKPHPGIPNYRTPAALYNGMVNPLVPYALRGVIWYQGESNTSHADGYAVRFAALITGWRKQFGQGDFPFYWVQLPNFDFAGLNQTNWQWAQLREAQTKTLAVPNTGQAITIDVGEAKSLHPKNKKPVGERLALLALARTYSVKNVIDHGPVFKSATRDGSDYRISYEPSVSPLKSAAGGLTGFELAGTDKVFHAADARIDGTTVVVTCPDVPEPVAVRYAYRNAPVAGLFNAEGLPAAPFRTDTW